MGLIPEYITIGKILSSWGLNGQIKVEVATDFPDRFSPSSEIWLDKQPVLIESTEWRKGQVILKLNTVNDLGTADSLREHLIEIPSSQLRPLPEGEYYHFQLIGLEVRTTGGEIIGEVTDVLAMSSSDIYVVKGSEGEILIPAIADVVKSIDIDNGLIVIEAIDGLLELNKKKSGR
jgi:16S rRNA processing protein RimM